LGDRVENVGEYLDELEKTKGDRPEQVREGLELYVDLWRRAIAKGVVEATDSVEDALEKMEAKGGLYASAGD
jgi:hypothetical protein